MSTPRGDENEPQSRQQSSDFSNAGNQAPMNEEAKLERASSQISEQHAQDLEILKKEYNEELERFKNKIHQDQLRKMNEQHCEKEQMLQEQVDKLAKENKLLYVRLGRSLEQVAKYKEEAQVH